MIFTPNFCDFLTFDSSASPNTRKLVFLLTESVTLPPWDSMNSFTPSRLNP